MRCVCEIDSYNQAISFKAKLNVMVASMMYI